MSTPLIETRNLNVRFGGVHATRDVNFTLAEAELRCVIGPNGAGKSTFFKLLTGQVKPTSGQILFRGQDISKMQPHDPGRLGIGIKTQVPSVFDGLDVLQNLHLAALRAQPSERAARAEAHAVLERVGLAGRGDARVGELAHGQRQWVELGMILASRPALVLLDEPAAGMTHHEVRKTAELIREINRASTVVVVEHDMAFIRMIAGRVTVFNRGEVLAEGSFDDVVSDPRVRDAYLGNKPIHSSNQETDHA